MDNDKYMYMLICMEYIHNIRTFLQQLQISNDRNKQSIKAEMQNWVNIIKSLFYMYMHTYYYCTYCAWGLECMHMENKHDWEIDVHTLWDSRFGTTQQATYTWWCHQMETFSAILALCEGDSQVNGEFPSQRPVTRSFDVFFDLRLNKQLSKQSCGRWFEMPSRSLWCHCNDCIS